MPLTKMVHDEDPAELIRRTVGAHPTPVGYQVLVGIYLRPEKMKSGLYVPQKTGDEDIWQGKVGMVLALGPRCYQPPKFDAPYCKEGDWVVFKPNEAGVPFQCNQGWCRLLNDDQIRAVQDRPDGIV